MIPSRGNLAKYISKIIKMDETLKLRGGDVATTALERSWGASLDGDGNSLSLRRNDASGDGLWIPYAEGEAVVGYFNSGRSWVGSGPFSGCKFVLGSANGRLFAAHIAKAGGVDAAETDGFYSEWRGKQKDVSEFYFNRIPIPNLMAFSCSYMFAEITSKGITSMTRIDVNVTRMGGGDGTITYVQPFK